ncbi:MAG: hypothetical protein Q9178_007939 [Gyalolechia marmorata]
MTLQATSDQVSPDHAPKHRQKWVGGRPPEKAHIYQLYTSTPIPCTTVWQGTDSRFNVTNPKPFSYQLYITDDSIPLPSPETTPTSQYHAPYTPGREATPSFAAEFLDALILGSETPETEQWRLDIWWVNGKGQSEACPWDVEECMAHYRATELKRRGEALHTVPTYFECSWLSGTPFRGVLLIVDGVEDWREQNGVRVVEFDLGVGKKVQGKDCEGLRLSVSYELDDLGSEDAETYERKWGTTVRDSRRSISVLPASSSRFDGYTELPLGGWLCTVERRGLMRQDYEALTGWKE